MNKTRKLFNKLSTGRNLASSKDAKGGRPSARGASLMLESLLDKAAEPLRINPKRILFIRSDSYGDLILFSPVLKIFIEAFPGSTIGLLMKAKHRDLIPLMPHGVQYLFTHADPHVESLVNSAHVVELKSLVTSFAPDLIIAPTLEKSWFHGVAAAAVPSATRICMGTFAPDADLEAYLRSTDAPNPLWDRSLDCDVNLHEHDKAERLAEFVIGRPVSLGVHRFSLQEETRLRTTKLMDELGLHPNGYVVCNPAGVANVSIKAWSPESFGAVLSHVCSVHGLKVLLVGHSTERSIIEAVRACIPSKYGALSWLGEGGDYDFLAGLCASARFYLGVDTSTLHLCEAFGVPVLGVYGGGCSSRFHPLLPGSIAVHLPLPCFGCGWDCHLGTAPCVTLITAQDVIPLVDGLLAGKFVSADKAARANVVSLPTPLRQLHDIAMASRAKYASLQSDRSARYNQIVSLTQIVHNAEAERARDSGTISALEAKLSIIGAELHDKEMQLGESQKRLSFVEGDSALRLKQVETLTAMVHGQEAEASLLRGQLANLNSQARGLEDMLREKDRLLTEARTDLQLQVEQLPVLNAVVKDKESQLASLAAKLRFVEDDSALRLKQIETLTAMVLGREAEVKLLNDQLETLNAANLNLKGKLRDAELDSERKQSLIEALRSELALAQRQCASLEGALGRCTAEVDELKSTVHILKEKAVNRDESASRESELARLKISNLESALELLTSALNEAEGRSGTLEAEAQGLQDRVSGLSYTIDELIKAEERYKLQIAQLEQLRLKEHQDHASSNQALADKNAQQQLCISELEKAREKLDVQNREIGLLLQESISQCDRLSIGNDMLEKQMQQLTQENQDLESKTEHMRVQLKQEIEVLRGALANLKGKYETLKSDSALDARRLELYSKTLECEVNRSQSLESLLNTVTVLPVETPTVDMEVARAHVDDAILAEGTLYLRGWCLPPNVKMAGGLIYTLLVQVDGECYVVRPLRSERLDVVEHFREKSGEYLLDPKCGFECFLECAAHLAGKHIGVRVVAQGAWGGLFYSNLAHVAVVT